MTDIPYPHLFEVFKESVDKSSTRDKTFLLNILGLGIALFILHSHASDHVVVTVITIIFPLFLLYFGIKIYAARIARHYPELAWKKALSKLEKKPITIYLNDLDLEMGFREAVEWTYTIMTPNYLFLSHELHLGMIACLDDITNVYVTRTWRKYQSPIYKLVISSRYTRDLILADNRIEIEDILREMRMRKSLPYHDSIYQYIEEVLPDA